LHNNIDFQLAKVDKKNFINYSGLPLRLWSIILHKLLKRNIMG